MSKAGTELINNFAALPPNERYAVLVELARMVESDAGPHSDDELTFAGTEIFSMYDAEEAARGESDPG